MVGLLVLCDIFVDVAYGKEWSPAVPVIAVLVPIAMLQSVTSMVGGIFQSQGRTDLQLRVGIVVTAFTLVSFVIGLRWGVVGVAAAYGVAQLLLAYPACAIPLDLVGLRVSDLLRAVARPLAASAIMGVVLVVARLAMPTPRHVGYLGFSLLVLLGVGTYFLSCVVLNRQLLRDVRRAIATQTDHVESMHT
jgi:PST family polysaccharide transporter